MASSAAGCVRPEKREPGEYSATGTGRDDGLVLRPGSQYGVTGFYFYVSRLGDNISLRIFACQAFLPQRG